MSLKVGWKCLLTESGELCVMITGILLTVLSSADSWNTITAVKASDYLLLLNWHSHPPPPTPYKAVTVFNKAEFGAGTGPIWLNEVNCSGFENRLLDCVGAYNTLGVNNCSHSKDAGVRCQGTCTCTCTCI